MLSYSVPRRTLLKSLWTACALLHPIRGITLLPWYLLDYRVGTIVAQHSHKPIGEGFMLTSVTVINKGQIIDRH
jgi:hypothetical protein